MILQGSFLDSVERSEISVTVGGEPCTVRQAPNDDINTVSFSMLAVYLITDPSICSLAQYVCSPPDQPPGGNNEASVVVNEAFACMYRLSSSMMFLHNKRNYALH